MMWWTWSLYFVFCLYLCLCCIVSVSLPNFRWIKIYIFIYIRLRPAFIRLHCTVSIRSHCSVLVVCCTAFSLHVCLRYCSNSSRHRYWKKKKKKNRKKFFDLIGSAAHKQEIIFWSYCLLYVRRLWRYTFAFALVEVVVWYHIQLYFTILLASRKWIQNYTNAIKIQARRIGICSNSSRRRHRKKKQKLFDLIGSAPRRQENRGLIMRFVCKLLLYSYPPVVRSELTVLQRHAEIISS